MALPTTGLTADFDASVMAGNVYSTISGGAPSGSVSSGGAVGAWKSSINGNHVFIPNTSGTVFQPPNITWENDSVLGLPSIKIQAGNMRPCLANSTGTSLSTSTFHTAGAKTLMFSFMLEDGSLLANSATAYLNTALVGNTDNNYFGTWLRNNGGIFTLYAYNYDGAADIVSTTILEDTRYVVLVTHDDTLNSGAGELKLTLIDISGETSQNTNSDTTTNVSTAWTLGDSNAGGTEQIRIRIGQISTWSARLTGTDLTDAKDFYVAKWLNTLVDAPAAASSYAFSSASVQPGAVSVASGAVVSSWSAVTPTVNGSSDSMPGLFLFLP